MKPLNPKLVLDPMWLCQANFVDLEYYTYILMDAKQKYLNQLETDFSNFYEIAFHYLNINTIIADKKVYDSHLNAVRAHQNLMVIVSQLAQSNDSNGKEIVRMASAILSEVMTVYLRKQIPVLEHLNFHLTNTALHKQAVIYIVCKSEKLDRYEIFKLNTKSNRPLGYSISRKAVLHLPGLKNNEFKDRLLVEMPTLTDFQPDKNVIVVSGTDQVVISDGICLTKDIILLNKIMNLSHGFDANVLLDYERMLDKKKAIPFKLKV
jgi:hypothetical protein